MSTFGYSAPSCLYGARLISGGSGADPIVGKRAALAGCRFNSLTTAVPPGSDVTRTRVYVSILDDGRMVVVAGPASRIVGRLYKVRAGRPVRNLERRLVR